MKRSAILIFVIGLSAVMPVTAQQTGSFDVQVNFMGQSRTLSGYVPASYNASTPHRLMIGLHGLGDNSNNYRNALINALKWQNNFPNTIFIFPDGGSDQFRDFYTPAGDEGIIAEAISYAEQNYNIDSNYVVLQGFSLGGRSAAKYGLENPAQFKGLFLNTPAFQGKQDADNQGPNNLNINYGNASQIPIYLTVGDQDIYYIILNTLVPKLKKQDAVIRYIAVPGIGHTVPDSTVTTPSFPFFENPTSADFDIDLFDSEAPQRSCNNSISPSCFVQNRGDAAITSLEINYQFGGNSGTHTWTGNLGSYQHAKINLPAMGSVAGQQELELSIGAVNGNQNDTVVFNNQLTDTVEVDLQGEALQVSEGFEANSPGWVFTETGTLFEWYRDTDVKQSGQASLANFGTILLFYTIGNVESFESPVLDLTSAQDPMLSYDIAYNYHKYTPPYFAADTSFADTLEIAISTDCGQSWQSLYKKGGSELATSPNPILNPLNLNQVFFQPSASEWRRDTIDLKAFENVSDAILRFNYISANGGSIYIDNISVGGEALSINELAPDNFEVFPNPARNQVVISTEEKISALKLYDIGGNVVLSKTGEGPDKSRISLEVGHLPTGVYQVEIMAGGQRTLRKLLITE